jgi:rabenosyn-5
VRAARRNWAREQNDGLGPSVIAMAARRSLGGGRVLGSGKNLAPPLPPSKPLPPSPVTGLLSPSESSVSLSSQTSSTPISTGNEDLTSRVALDEHGSAQAAAAASSRMQCPICGEEMVRRL